MRRDHPGQTVFSQVMARIPRWEFLRAYAVCDVRSPRSDAVSPRDHFLTLSFAQMTFRESLHDIEACINAREHACCADERIYLRFLGGVTTDGRAKLEVWIKDRGVGFDLSKVKPREPGKADAPRKRGWGLQIMRAHVDDLEISSGADGTTIHMVKFSERRRDD